jgi:hypothetical protein
MFCIVVETLSLAFAYAIRTLRSRVIDSFDSAAHLFLVEETIKGERAEPIALLPSS